HLQGVEAGAAGEVGHALAAGEGEPRGQARVGAGHVPAPELVVPLRDLVIGERRQVGKLGARRGQGPSSRVGFRPTLSENAVPVSRQLSPKGRTLGAVGGTNSRISRAKRGASTMSKVSSLPGKRRRAWRRVAATIASASARVIPPWAMTAQAS